MAKAKVGGGKAPKTTPAPSIEQLISGIFQNPRKTGLSNIGSGILEGLGLPGRAFGFTPRDPTGELEEGLGLDTGFRGELSRDVRDSGIDWDAVGIDQDLFQQMVSSADPNLMPYLADAFGYGSTVSPIIGQLNDFASMAGDEVGGDFIAQLKAAILKGTEEGAVSEDAANRGRASISSQAGADLSGVLSGLRDSFNPDQAAALLGGKELDARLTASGNLGTNLANFDIGVGTANAAAKTGFINSGTGLNDSIARMLGVGQSASMGAASLIPRNVFTGAQDRMGSLIDTDINNQRIEELSARGDFAGLLTAIQGQTDRFMSTLLPALFPGTYGANAGGSDDSSAEAMGWTGLGLEGLGLFV